jgi:hypothetical protein
MDNTSSDNNSSNYNTVQPQQNQYSINSSSTEKPKYEAIKQNNNNQDLYAPNPISNSHSNNQTQFYSYNPNIIPTAYPYNPNIKPQGNYPYNPNTTPNSYFYNPNPAPSQESQYYKLESVTLLNEDERPQYFCNTKNICLIVFLLIISLLMFSFVIFENIVISSKGKAFKIWFIIVDEIGILICGILYLISFILSIRKKNITKLSIARTVITIIVWFSGVILRGVGTKRGEYDNDETYATLLGIRSILLFFSIPASIIICKNIV